MFVCSQGVTQEIVKWWKIECQIDLLRTMKVQTTWKCGKLGLQICRYKHNNHRKMQQGSQWTTWQHSPTHHDVSTYQYQCKRKTPTFNKIWNYWRLPGRGEWKQGTWHTTDHRLLAISSHNRSQALQFPKFGYAAGIQPVLAAKRGALGFHRTNFCEFPVSCRKHTSAQSTEEFEEKTTFVSCASPFRSIFVSFGCVCVCVCACVSSYSLVVSESAFTPLGLWIKIIIH